MNNYALVGEKSSVVFCVYQVSCNTKKVDLYERFHNGLRWSAIKNRIDLSKARSVWISLVYNGYNNTDMKNVQFRTTSSINFNSIP